MRIVNLKGAFTGSGFHSHQGRKPTWEHAGYIEGPLEIVIDDSTGMIQSIATQDSPVSKNDPSLFNAEGLIASPAFHDSHTHTLFSGHRYDEAFQRWSGKTYSEITKGGGGIHRTITAVADSSDESLVEQLKRRLQRMVLSGSATVEIKTGYGLDPAGELRILRILKHYKQNPEAQQPKILTTFLGLHALPQGHSETEYVRDMMSLFPLIKKENLCDFIDAFPEEGFFSLESARLFFAEGAKHGLRAKVHADELTNMESSFEFASQNALSVDHLQQISDAGIKTLASSRTVATLLPSTSFYLKIPYAPARKLLNAGARVALATDFNPGTAPYSKMKFVFSLAASQLCLSPSEILCAATYNAAGALGLDGPTGTGVLEAGRAADILLWSSEQRETPQLCLERFLLDEEDPIAVFVQGRPIANSACKFPAFRG